MDTDGGREMRGNLAGKQEIAGKQEESRFNHRGHRGPPRKRGKEGGERETIFNIQQGIFNSQGFWRGYLSAVAEPPCCPGSGIRIARITTNGGRWGESGINLNSRTHEQINQPVSRQDAKAQRGRERRGNLTGKQEIAGKQEESRFNHRGPPRGTEGERKRGRGEGNNIQYSTRNIQCSISLEFSSRKGRPPSLKLRRTWRRRIRTKWSLCRALQYDKRKP
jgi:hypothetical protein